MMRDDVKLGALAAVIFGLCFGVSFGLTYGVIYHDYFADQVEACCPLDGEDYHRSPHPDKECYGTMTRITAGGVKFYHYKVKTTGQEILCGGHDKSLDEGLPCDNLGDNLGTAK
jgi:hypothetical protein